LIVKTLAAKTLVFQGCRFIWRPELYRSTPPP